MTELGLKHGGLSAEPTHRLSALPWPSQRRALLQRRRVIWQESHRLESRAGRKQDSHPPCPQWSLGAWSDAASLFLPPRWGPADPCPPSPPQNAPRTWSQTRGRWCEPRTRRRRSREFPRFSATFSLMVPAPWLHPAVMLSHWASVGKIKGEATGRTNKLGQEGEGSRP